MDLGKHLEKAAEAVRRRNYPFAIGLYNQLLALRPDDGEARAGLRNALFRRAEKSRPSRVSALVFGGVHLLSARLFGALGRHGATAKAYERYLAKDPFSESANLALARALVRANCPASALAVYRAYATREPRCLEASREAGHLLYAQGELQDALAMFEQALKVDPRDQEALKARKDLAAEGAIRNAGLEQARSSRELLKDEAEQRRLERSDRRQLSAEEIEAELGKLEERVAEAAEDQKAWERMGDLHLMRDDPRSALDCLERALTMAASDPELAARVGDLRLRIHEEQVRAAEASGDADAAERARGAYARARVQEFRRRVERNPSDLALRHDLGEGLLAEGALDEAIAELQKAVQDPRRQAEAHLLLGQAFRKKELPDVARGQLEKGLEACVGRKRLSQEIRYELGLVCEQAGDLREALGHFSRILEQDIGFRDVAEKVEQLKAS